jgi:methionine-rich copper-binding protein CopC
VVRILTLLTLGALGAAYAYAELVSSSPARGATLSEPPSEVRLHFSEGITLESGLFKVYPLPVEAARASTEMGAAHQESTAATGGAAMPADAGKNAALEAAATLVAQVLPLQNDADARVDTGLRAEGTTLTLDLQEALPPGDYVVMWRALSEDGHLIQDFFTFVYEPVE